jgi:hypothetical protein
MLGFSLLIGHPLKVELVSLKNWKGVSDSLMLCPPSPNLIVAQFPPLFEGFRAKRLKLLWRGSRDGFRQKEFHPRCEGSANALMLILDTNGTIFGGFTSLEWESRVWNGKAREESNTWKGYDSLGVSFSC